MVHAFFGVDREIVMRVPTNSHAYKTRVIPTWAIFMCVPCIFRVSQKTGNAANATSALVAG